MTITKKILNFLVYRSRALRWKLMNKFYSCLLGRMNLSYQLPTGVTISVSSFADWTIYNDIFVGGEYDAPIRRALQSGARPVRILDLGANVGLFLKRVLHLRRASFREVAVEIICVEGAPSTFSALQRQIPCLEAGESVQVLHGLAGEKNGEASLTTNPFHAMTSLARQPRPGGVTVKFLDLYETTKDWPHIDLLKCDIEGAEQMVLENYEDLLRKVKLGVFEFHLFCINHEHCLDLCSRAGLSQRNVLHADQHLSVEALSQ
jgi:FkbM family methyltransferase